MGGQKKATQEPYRIRITENALKNIDEITGYIAFICHQPFNAIKVGDAIYEAFERIAKYPFAFRECSELPTRSKMYRRAICLSWMIVYKITYDEIIVIGVVHCSRKPTAIKAFRKIR